MGKLSKVMIYSAAVAATVFGVGRVISKVAEQNDDASFFPEHQENTGFSGGIDLGSINHFTKQDATPVENNTPVQDVAYEDEQGTTFEPIDIPAPDVEEMAFEDIYSYSALDEPEPVVEEAFIEEVEEPLQEPVELPMEEPVEEVLEEIADEPAPMENTIMVGNAIISDDANNGFIQLVSSVSGKDPKDLVVLAAPGTTLMVFAFAGDARNENTLAGVYFVSETGEVTEAEGDELQNVMAFGRAFITQTPDFQNFLAR